MIDVEVIYATPQEQRLIPISLPDGATVRDALELSGVLLQHPEISLDRCRLGIFSRRVKPDQVLSAGDRVEIYRPLKIQPRDRRRRRAEEGPRRSRV